LPSRDNYMSVARQIADYLNAFGLGFKTYRVSELDDMVKAVAGPGARVTGGGDASEQLENALLQRGFLLFPPIGESEDGYVRVIRSNTIIGNLLNAFRYPGANGDTELARLLRALKSRHRPDDLTSAPEATDPQA